MRKLIIVLLMFMCFFNSSCDDNSYIINNTVPNFETSNMLIIDLKGAIRIPNIYTVKEGTILYDLITLAGGLDSNADISNINLALTLHENQMIMIPFKKEVSDNLETTSDKININTATLDELCTLPGIGTSKATNIINYRNSNGYFIKIDDIKKVSGISEGLFNKIKEYICV